MKIRTFQENDILEASKMAYKFWSYELAETNQEFNHFIYEYMVRYYDLNRQYSFSIEDKELGAFLLAGFKTDQNTSEKWFENALKHFSDSEKKVARGYCQYLQNNGNAVKKHMQKHDILVGLFMSRVHKAGKILLENLEKICHDRAIKNIFLWADVTCNYSYYEKNGFEIIERYENDASLDIACLDTYIFKKRLN